MDETFVVSAQSPDQTELLTNHNPSNAVFVEGGFTVWLRSKSLTYFILRSETTDAFRVYKENSAKEVNQEEYYKGKFKHAYFSDFSLKIIINT